MNIFFVQPPVPPGREEIRKTSDSPIVTFLQNIHSLPTEAIEVLERDCYTEHFEKGRFIVERGQVCDGLYLIIKGVVRSFVLEDEREITTWINEEHELIAPIRSLGLNIPSEEFLQVLEPTTVIHIPQDLLDHLYDNYPEANRIARILLEENYRGAEERAYICRIHSAEKKYERFIATKGSLINRVPLKYIASYLNMTIETLSRIRNKKRYY